MHRVSTVQYLRAPPLASLLGKLSWHEADRVCQPSTGVLHLYRNVSLYIAVPSLEFGLQSDFSQHNGHTIGKHLGAKGCFTDTV